MFSVTLTSQDPLECFLSWNTWKGIVPSWCSLSTSNFSSLCWNSVGHCRMSQAVELVCSSNVSGGCSRHNLALLTTAQTANPTALGKVAEFLGLNPKFYTATHGTFQAVNMGKSGRHTKQVLCQERLMTILQELKRIFYAEYGRLAKLLETFQLIEGSAEVMLAARDWNCEENMRFLTLLLPELHETFFGR